MKAMQKGLKETERWNLFDTIQLAYLRFKMKIYTLVGQNTMTSGFKVRHNVVAKLEEDDVGVLSVVHPGRGQWIHW